MIVIGIDEVGRGSWAGPVIAAAVALSGPIPGLADSKRLTKARRAQLSQIIYAKAAYVGVGWVSAAEVDTAGLTAAVGTAMRRAMAGLTIDYDDLVIDGNINYLADVALARTLVKADQLIQAVSAASIVAKVARDSFMTEQALQYSGYGFESHVGYGTQKHRQAIMDYGICELHRRSVKPIKQLGAIT